MYYKTVADLGGFGGCGRTPLAFFRKIQRLPISKIVRTADSTIIIITNFYLAASSHEIFLRVGGREGMNGLGALQRHQLPHPPCKNPGSATASTHCGRCSRRHHNVICFVAPRRGFALVPCGHARFCESCANRVYGHVAASAR